ncbi:MULTISPECIES: DoxX family protein [unclassified Cellulomonas]|uniref:DoxX family protein n=1 Tax=unclassified Cellulomonas TaxID=2620175 RepID=UPI0024B687C8|nr:DoxX family protein [Cellulomonas sp. ES6]WHP17297.1 DoxX family protein [Cellulomonas sp. ES6]
MSVRRGPPEEDVMLLRRIARPLFASWFLSEGVDALRRPSAHVPVARDAVERLNASVPRGALGGALDAYRHPSDAQLTTLVRAHGGATALAALLLATGRAPRAAALALAALTLPLAAADAPPSRKERAHLDAEQKKARKARFLRGLSLTGGALIAAADTAGRPSVRWRVEHARATRAAAASAAGAASGVAAAGRAARRTVTEAVR